MNLELNEREITPLNLWINGVSSTATIIKLDGYSGYNFVDSPGEAHYILTDSDKNSIVQGVVELDWQTVADWGADDQVIFDYVAQQLNLTLI